MVGARCPRDPVHSLASSLADMHTSVARLAAKHTAPEAPRALTPKDRSSSPKASAAAAQGGAMGGGGLRATAAEDPSDMKSLISHCRRWGVSTSASSMPGGGAGMADGVGDSSPWSAASDATSLGSVPAQAFEAMLSSPSDLQRALTEQISALDDIAGSVEASPSLALHAPQLAQLAGDVRFVHHARAVPCRHCGRLFFQRSLPFHMSRCARVKALEVVNCPKCGRECRRSELDRHAMRCGDDALLRLELGGPAAAAALPAMPSYSRQETAPAASPATPSQRPRRQAEGGRLDADAASTTSGLGTSPQVPRVSVVKSPARHNGGEELARQRICRRRQSACPGPTAAPRWRRSRNVASRCASAGAASGGAAGHAAPRTPPPKRSPAPAVPKRRGHPPASGARDPEWASLVRGASSRCASTHPSDRRAPGQTLPRTPPPKRSPLPRVPSKRAHPSQLDARGLDWTSSASPYTSQRHSGLRVDDDDARGLDWTSSARGSLSASPCSSQCHSGLHGDDGSHSTSEDVTCSSGFGTSAADPSVCESGGGACPASAADGSTPERRSPSLSSGVGRSKGSTRQLGELRRNVQALCDKLDECLLPWAPDVAAVSFESAPEACVGT